METSKTNIPANIAEHEGDSSQHIIGQLLPESDIIQFTKELDMMVLRLSEFSEAISVSEHIQRIGAGIRNYGFVDKTSEVAKARPEFAPANFNSDTLKDLLKRIDMLRTILLALQQLNRIIRDDLLITSNEAFNQAQIFYSAVRDAANRKEPGAEDIFKTLQPFFNRTKSVGEASTEKELELEIDALLQGHKDDKI